MNSPKLAWIGTGRLLLIATALVAVLCGAAPLALAQVQPCVPACRPGETCVSGMCMVPARRAPPPPQAPRVAAPPPAYPPPPPVAPAQPEPPPPPPPVAPAPPPPPPEPAAVEPEPLPQVTWAPARSKSSSPAPDHKGVLIMPFMGIHSFQRSADQELDAGLRIGGMLGGFVAPQVSLNGSFSFDLLNIDTRPNVNANGQVYELAFSPLFHLGNRQFEAVVGPKLGAWLGRTHLDDTTILGDALTELVQGWLIGLNAGAFVHTGAVSTGLMLNLDLRDLLHACAKSFGVETCYSSAPSDVMLGAAFAVML